MTKIGLEVHLHLNLKKKLFCDCNIDYDAKPNTTVCEICLGLPGSMPHINIEAILAAFKLAKYFNMNIETQLQFDRKHYIYPDLPKGYQLTQYFKPIGINGYIELRRKYEKIGKIIRFTDLKLEEDPAKTTESIIDFNRSGCALIELVTEPDFDNAEDVVFFLKQLLNICEDLQIVNSKLSSCFRADVNISTEKSKRVEIKNIGSIDDIYNCINFEINRLNQEPAQSIHTRNFIKGLNITTFSRHKQTHEEYAFIKEPDLPITDVNISINDISTVYERFDEFMKKINLKKDYIWNLVYNRKIYESYLKDKKITNKYCQIITKIIKEYNYRNINKDNEFEVRFFNQLFLDYDKYTMKEIENRIRYYFGSEKLSQNNLNLTDIFNELIKQDLFNDALNKLKYEKKSVNYIIGAVLKKNPSINIKDILTHINGINNN